MIMIIEMKRYYNWYKKKEVLWILSGEDRENWIGHYTQR